MRHDPFFRKQSHSSDEIIKSRPVRKDFSDNDVREDWNAAHPQYPAPAPIGSGYVVAILIDESAVIVEEGGRKWKVPYSFRGDQAVFDDAARVEVQTTWSPVGKCGVCPRATEAEKRVAKGSGDFTDCMDRIVPAAKPDDPEAFCAWYEHEQTGSWPGEKVKSAKAALPPGRADGMVGGGPRVVEVDGDQDSVAREMVGSTPTDSFRPGYVTDDAPEGGDLVSPVGKDEDVLKVWSDEARAAAAEARRAGYRSRGGRRGGEYSHPEGHQIIVRPTGSWTHAHAQGGSKEGEGARSLRDRLTVDPIREANEARDRARRQAAVEDPKKSAEGPSVV